MSLVRLVYASRFSRKAGPEDVQKIVDLSRKKNEELGITGALCFDPRYFLQVLEGPREAVSDLYNRIMFDYRHTGVTLISYEKVAQRRFEKWFMAYVRIDQKVKPILDRYTTNGFDPYSMDPEQLVDFAAEVAEARSEKGTSVAGGTAVWGSR